MLYPAIEPFHSSYLQVSPVHLLYYEQVGRPDGIPVVFLHGGPGGGINPYCRRFFNPHFYRAVLFDQRGSGKSKPFASVQDNTTPHLIEDIEKLRVHLNIDKWFVFGGSWGSTLALAYAIAHPDKVLGMVLRGVFLGCQDELDWLYGPNGAARLFPELYESFSSFLSPNEKRRPYFPYYRKLTEGTKKQQLDAMRLWNNWENGISQLIPDPLASEVYASSEKGLAIARIECHYFVHDLFLPNEDYLLDGARKLHHIPTEIINGRYDIVCPPWTAHKLHQALPDSHLIIVPDAGHSTTEKGIATALVSAMSRMRTFV